MFWDNVNIIEVHIVKANIHSGFFNGLVRFGTVSIVLWKFLWQFIFHVRRTKLIETIQKIKKVEFNPTIFWTAADHFGTLFLHPMRFLPMGHVTKHIFKSCKQTRCQRNIFFYLIVFIYVLLYSTVIYCTVSIIFCWKPCHIDPIHFKWILHIGSGRNGSLNRTVSNHYKKNRSEFSPLKSNKWLTWFPRWLFLDHFRVN